jgi:hypothetical protein
MAPNQDGKRVRRATFVVQGHGHFKANGSGWSSHQVRVVIQVTEDFDGETPATKIVRRFGQKPAQGGAYTRPTFKRDEEQRMVEVALRYFERLLSIAGGNDGSDTMTVPASLAQSELHKRHRQDLCEYCRTHLVPCTRTVEVLEGHMVFIKDAKAWQRRARRIEAAKTAVAAAGGNWGAMRQIPQLKVLYHQTSEQNATAILNSVEMRRGHNGMFGGGIYFAATPEETDAKAHARSVVLQCAVFVGRAKKVRNACPTLGFSSVDDEGFDSVHAVSSATFLPTGDEFVVYNSDQVLAIRRLPR